MAVPKGKVSRQRRDKRRSSHWKLTAPALVACPKCGALHQPHSSVWKLATPGLVACPKCGALHLPHRMCPECGTYNGRQVKVIESKVAAE